ncbi:helix-turn-helix domain-containing protein [Xanthocytophaga agilis]|uniref:Helix-turn-helix domain-containing protein n=1 Tax=Xanthocytophaga agilis TaxID=3048010 RepID=A0AAE3UEV8_9BACT|nr:helix-turn-helix domain-containing protein [Xanthocytophaga agilis]MDJ1501751.1 helix-turn-helix domain-containing protein [Xanthocytophaga agilis]
MEQEETKDVCQYKTSVACVSNLRAAKDVMDVIQGKWRIPIIVALTYGNKRFGEILRDLGDISPKVLSKELKSLEESKLVIRTTYDTIPVTVEYSLTPLGLSLEKVLDPLIGWGIHFRKEIIN